jgi:hypothetical protein
MYRLTHFLVQSVREWQVVESESPFRQYQVACDLQSDQQEAAYSATCIHIYMQATLLVE